MLLGRVVAHEVGHALLLTLRHAAHGLMSPQLEQRDVTPLGAAQFALSASDRDRLAMRFSNRPRPQRSVPMPRRGGSRSRPDGRRPGRSGRDTDHLDGRAACSFSAARAALRIPRRPSLPSWHAYSKIGCSSSRVSRMPKVHGFTQVDDRRT